jgi:hypothetical protein
VSKVPEMAIKVKKKKTGLIEAGFDNRYGGGIRI